MIHCGISLDFLCESVCLLAQNYNRICHNVKVAYFWVEFVHIKSTRFVYAISFGNPWYLGIFIFIHIDMMHLLTAIGLTPGASSTVHIYTQTIHRTTQLTIFTKWPTRCNCVDLIYFSFTVLHVSSGIFAHHHEHLKCNYSFWFYSCASSSAAAMAAANNDTHD